MIRAALLLLMLPTTIFAQANEKGLWRLWELHTENRNDHKTIIQACLTFKKQNPSDPFVAVSNTLAAWHVLKLGFHDQAVNLLEPYLKVEDREGLDEGAAEMARTWATRVDRERLAKALKFYYNKEVKFPTTLTELREYEILPPELEPVPQDRFGKPWKYRLAGFKSIPGLFDQKYELESGKLGIDSDLTDSLDWPYGERMHITPVAMKGNDTLEVVRGRDMESQRIPVSAGRKIDDVLVAYLGRNIIVLCNKDHWSVLRRPTGP